VYPDRVSLDAAIRVGTLDRVEGPPEVPNAPASTVLFKNSRSGEWTKIAIAAPSASITSAPGEPVARYTHDWRSVATERSNNSTAFCSTNLTAISPL
jgi:hypothetical protein